MRGKGSEWSCTPVSDGITPAYAGKRHQCANLRVLLRDHPRVCGEKLLCPAQPRRCRGSPPRMRGKVCCIVCAGMGQRITPAYAGKSIRRNKKCRTLQDHPRVCGEKTGQSWEQAYIGGSPPRMRGKVTKTVTETGERRITPAYAGKSGIIFVYDVLRQDHPRVCGEKSMMVPHTLTRLGSPPRMRGKAAGKRFFALHPRITPAYAGKSS